MRATVWRQDRDDWMLSPAEFHSLDMEFGPFTLDSGAYSTGARAFVAFCIAFAGLGCLEPLLPASDNVLVRFITFSSWFVAPSTIKNYLAAVRPLHLQRGHAWRPVAERFRVAVTLQGVRRYWDRPSKPVMPLTLQNLLDMSRHVDFGSLSELALWAAILVGFFGLFRKDNLTVGKEDAYNPRATLVRDDVLFTEDGETVWIRVRAGDSPLFVVEKAVGRKVQVVPLTHAGLVGGIKRLVKAAGLRPEAYAGHSLKRGGATMAKQLEVHTMYIKHQGDWRSDRYERYREMQPEQRLILPGAMAAAAATLT
eukprot:gene21598-biopygen22309